MRIERAQRRPQPATFGLDTLAAGLLDTRRCARIVVIAAVCFNAVLALVNANLVALSPAAVIACEATLTIAATGLAVLAGSPASRPWLFLIGLVLLFGLANGFGSGGIDPKLIRDVLLIPVFVLLGLVCDRRDIVRVIMPLQAIVLAVTLFEGLRPEDFGRVFGVMSYFINTRGFEEASFWNQDSDLFISATRPGERFLLGGLDIHRLSSIFLEPVSLGNYCVLVAVIVAALWTLLSVRQRLFLCLSNVVLLIGCDGRFATASIALIVVLRIVAPALPRYFNWIYLPGVVGAGALAVAIFHLQSGGDDFPTRTAGSIEALSQMGVVDLMGYATWKAYTVMDSGISYLVYSQSLLGTVILWSFIACGLRQQDRPAVVTAHAVSLYFATNLMISYSVFSIKTAALVWFIYGAMQNAGVAPLQVRLPRARRLRLGGRVEGLAA